MKELELGCNLSWVLITIIIVSFLYGLSCNEKDKIKTAFKLGYERQQKQGTLNTMWVKVK